MAMGEVIPASRFQRLGVWAVKRIATSPTYVKYDTVMLNLQAIFKQGGSQCEGPNLFTGIAILDHCSLRLS